MQKIKRTFIDLGHLNDARMRENENEGLLIVNLRRTNDARTRENENEGLLIG